MRVHRSDLAGLQVHGEDADVIVFEDYAVGIAGDFDDVLRRSGTGRGEEDAREEQRGGE